MTGGRFMSSDSNWKHLEGEFSPWMLLLCITGLAINLILSKLVIFLNLPLYVDNVGSIIVAILGGPILGMAVGFLSNILGSLSTPISMYYSIFTIIIAWLAAVFSRKGVLKHWWGWLIAAGSFILAGGGAGSIVTWLLYGQTISGLAMPYALILTNYGISPFFAQLIIDIIIDIPDKLITVFIAWFLLHIFPKKFLTRFPYSYWYYNSHVDVPADYAPIETHYKHPLKNRLISIVTITVVLIGIFSLASGSYFYQQQISKNCQYIAQMISAQAALCVNGDKVDDQLANGRNATGYQETEDKLYAVLNRAPSSIRYLYIYQVRSDGIYIVFDLDVPGEKGRETGMRVVDDIDIENRMDLFLAGGEVEPGTQNNEYGSLLSAYTPIQNSDGITVACCLCLHRYRHYQL